MKPTTSGSDHKIDYEERSVPLGKLFLWTVGLFASIGGVLAFVYYVYGTPSMRPVPELVLNRAMNQPALQSDGYADQKKFRAQQEEILSTYGWVNKGAGIVRIPVEQAMDLVIQRGLPSRGGGKE